MLSVLGYILSGIELIGSFVLWAVETVVNAVGVAVVALYTALLALLPSMSSAPVIGHPQWLDWLSWFYPVGDLLGGLTALVVLWTGFLVVRFALRFIRAI